MGRGSQLEARAMCSSSLQERRLQANTCAMVRPVRAAWPESSAVDLTFCAGRRHAYPPPRGLPSQKQSVNVTMPDKHCLDKIVLRAAMGQKGSLPVRALTVAAISSALICWYLVVAAGTTHVSGHPLHDDRRNTPMR